MTTYGLLIEARNVIPKIFFVCFVLFLFFFLKVTLSKSLCVYLAREVLSSRQRR